METIKLNDSQKTCASCKYFKQPDRCFSFNIMSGTSPELTCIEWESKDG